MHLVGSKGEAKMKLEKHDVPGVSQTSASVMNGEESRQSVRRRPVGPRGRVREIDCMLADIQAHMQRLRQERTYLGLVRDELA